MIPCWLYKDFQLNLSQNTEQISPCGITLIIKRANFGIPTIQSEIFMRNYLKRLPIGNRPPFEDVSWFMLANVDLDIGTE